MSKCDKSNDSSSNGGVKNNLPLPFKHQSSKMVKQTQTIR